MVENDTHKKMQMKWLKISVFLVKSDVGKTSAKKLHGVKNETFIISTFGKVISESIYLIKCIERKIHRTTLATVLWLMSKHEANLRPQL